MGVARDSIGKCLRLRATAQAEAPCESHHPTHKYTPPLPCCHYPPQLRVAHQMTTGAILRTSRRRGRRGSAAISNQQVPAERAANGWHGSIRVLSLTHTSLPPLSLSYTHAYTRTRAHTRECACTISYPCITQLVIPEAKLRALLQVWLAVVERTPCNWTTMCAHVGMAW